MSSQTKGLAWQVLFVWLTTALFYAVGAFEWLELGLMDARFKWLPKRSVADNLVVVDIDARSLSALEEWPWPRRYHARVLEELTAAESQWIVFDIDLSARSGPDDDALLAQALAASAAPVFMPIFKQANRDGTNEPSASVTKPLNMFLRHIGLVSINVHPAPDGKIRRMPVYESLDGKLTPTIATALARGRMFQSREPYYIDYSFDPTTIPRISYVDVLRGTFDHRQVAGRDVIIGATALELRDQVPVPVYHTLAGPLLHTLAYQSITENRALSRTGPGWVMALSILLAALITTLLDRCAWRGGLLLTAALAAMILIASMVFQLFHPVIVDVTPLLFLTLLSYATVTVAHMDRQTVTLSDQSRRIRDHNALMRGIVENSFDAIITVNIAEEVESFNPSAEAMFRRSTPDVIGVGIRELIPNLAEILSATTGGARVPLHATVEAVGHWPDGGTFPLELSITEMQVGERRLYVCSARDITERYRQTEALKHQALHDDLTGLPNRTLLNERLCQAIKRGKRDGTRFALLVMDLDNFKDVNDTLGHHLGDQLLQHTAQRLLGIVRGTDTLGRLGGDEFALLVADISSPDEVEMVAGKLVHALERPFSITGLTLHIGISIGCSLFPEHGEDVNTLLQRADVAMYVAKRLHLRYGVYEFSQDQNSVRQLTLRGELRRAIEDEQLTLHYQPKIHLDTNQIAGAEVLVRWQHPTHGFLPPDEFIPMAEQTGLITALSQWVLATSLRQCATWRQADKSMSISVNLSVKDLMNSELPDTAHRLLAQSGLPAECLTLEVTESHIMSDPQRALSTLDAFYAMGVRITIDDFGTGYSSLGYLKRLPIHELKIDKSFVTDMHSDKNDLAIVRSTIDLAHNLGLTVVAEGVSTAAAMNLLRDMGCDAIQGYWISAPLSAEDFTDWLQNTGNRGAGKRPKPKRAKKRGARRGSTKAAG